MADRQKKNPTIPRVNKMMIFFFENVLHLYMQKNTV